MSIANITNELIGSPVDSMRDIRLTYKKGSRIARIKVGGEWVDRGVENLAPADVKPWLIKERDRLQEEFGAKHPIEGSTAPHSNQTTSGNSFKARLLHELEKWIKRQELRNPDNYYSALNHVWKVFGAKADLDTKRQVPASFAQLRIRLLESGKADSTLRLYFKHIRELLEKVVKYGLHPDCIAELKNIRKQGDPEASGEAFRVCHLKVILDRVRTQVDSIRILIWIGLSGGPQIVDAVFLPLTGVNWDTGLISYRRVKTGERIEFAAMPPLLELLKERRDRLGPGAIFALPELIFTAAERKDPKFNTVAVSKVSRQAAVRGADNGMRLMNEFLTSCGIKTKDITYKSFRKHHISFWASIGIKLKTRMRMAGHSRENAHFRYDTPAEFEILRARDITWQYLEAVRENREFFIPTTPYDIYRALMDHWEKWPAMLRAHLVEQHGTFERLEKALIAGFAEQKSYLEAKFHQLEGKILELTLSVQSMAIQVRRLGPRSV